MLKNSMNQIPVHKGDRSMATLNEQYKVGDHVVPKIGPHAGQVHRVIHVHDTGHLNITPVRPGKNRYHLGAAKASPNDVTTSEQTSIQESSWMIIDHEGKRWEVLAKDRTDAMKQAVSVGGTIHPKGVPMTQWKNIKVVPMPATGMYGKHEQNNDGPYRFEESTQLDEISALTAKHVGDKRHSQGLKFYGMSDRSTDPLVKKVFAGKAEKLNKKAHNAYGYSYKKAHADAKKLAEGTKGVPGLKHLDHGDEADRQWEKDEKARQALKQPAGHKRRSLFNQLYRSQTADRPGYSKMEESMELDESFMRTYNSNENANRHTANIVHLAKHFGTKADQAQAKFFADELKKHGHNIHHEAAYKLHEKLWPSAVAAHNHVKEPGEAMTPPRRGENFSEAQDFAADAMAAKWSAEARVSQSAPDLAFHSKMAHISYQEKEKTKSAAAKAYHDQEQSKHIRKEINRETGIISAAKKLAKPSRIMAENMSPEHLNYTITKAEHPNTFNTVKTVIHEALRKNLRSQSDIDKFARRGRAAKNLLGLANRELTKLATKTAKELKESAWDTYRRQALTEASLNVKTLSAEEIAQKHGVSLDTIKDQIAKGIKVEHEHATSDQTAEEIARDHLGERPDYYTKLAKANLEEADLKAQWNDDYRKDAYARRKNLSRTIKQQLNPKTPGLGNKAWKRADKEERQNRKSTVSASLHELHDEPDRPGTGIGISGDGTEKGMAMTEDGGPTRMTITKAEWDDHTRHATAQFDPEGQRWIVKQDAKGSATRIPVTVTEDYPYRQTIRRILREAFPMAPKSTEKPEKPDNTQDDEEQGEAPKVKKEKAIDPVVIGKSKDKFEADPILTPVLSVANMPGGSVR
jgi:hypothetical protein